jgi:hypothetical protein
MFLRWMAFIAYALAFLVLLSSGASLLGSSSLSAVDARDQRVCAPCESSVQAGLRSELRGNEPLFEREENDLGIVLEAELVHDVILVKHDRLLAHLENSGDFFHRTPFGEQL